MSKLAKSNRCRHDEVSLDGFGDTDNPQRRPDHVRGAFHPKTSTHTHTAPRVPRVEHKGARRVLHAFQLQK